MPLLTTQNIWKSYGEGAGKSVSVLRGASIEIEQGDFITICGASGSGKSTLLHILGGLDQPEKGEVLYDNVSLYKQTDEEISDFRNRHVGFVFQFYHLLPEFTACENVMMASLIGGVDFKTAKQKALHLLASVGLKERTDHRPSELSGGEQQRVALSRALMRSPALLLADEPTGNLDKHSGEEVMKLLRRVAAGSKSTVVMVTHNQELIASTDRQFELREGKLYELA